MAREIIKEGWEKIPCAICNNTLTHKATCGCGCGQIIPIKYSHIRHKRCPEFLTFQHMLRWLAVYNTGKPHPEWRKQKQSQTHSTPKFINQMRAYWNTPEYRNKVMKMIHKRPTEPERYVDAILQLNFPHEWKYVGDGKVWIEGKNPDFINCNGKKIVIEFNGYKPKHTPERDKAKTEYYMKYGFKVINLNYEDIRSENILIERIKWQNQ